MNLYVRFQYPLVITVLLLASRQAAALPLIDEVIVFGDSLSDTGNVHLLSQGAFAGEPYFGGRFSNGPVWVEWLAHWLDPLKYSEPTLHAPALVSSRSGGTNYAHGGAQAGPRFSEPLSGRTGMSIPNVGMQVEMFLAELATSGQSLDGNELFVVQGGSNNNSGGLAATRMADHVATLAAAGGKNFLVPNLWFVSQDPFAVVDDRRWDRFVAGFNATLSLELDALELQNPEINIIRLNMLDWHNQVVENPGAFGLENVTDPACPECAAVSDPDAAASIVGNPEKFLYWDAYHLSGEANRILGEFALGELQQSFATSPSAFLPDTEVIPEPSTISLAILAAIVLAGLSKSRRPKD